MSLPKQPIGLTNFSGSVNCCPPNPDAIRAIVFSRDNLAVVNGATTEIQIPLDKFFIPVDEAARTSFTIPGATPGIPYVLDKLDLAGVQDLLGQVKFIGLFPQYGTGASANSMNIEWTTAKSIEEGELYTTPPLPSLPNSNMEYWNANKLSFSWGGSLSKSSGPSGKLYAATDGGLLEWDGSKSKLWNTLNSQIPTDYINSIVVDNDDAVWLATNIGIIKYQPSQNGVFTSTPYIEYANDIKLVASDGFVAATNNGLSVFYKDFKLIGNYNIYNSPLLKHNTINTVEVSDDLLIFAGTTGGVYVFDSNTMKWHPKPLNSSTVQGWTCSDEVLSMAIYNSILYVGTPNGLVSFPYTGATGSITPFPGIDASVITELNGPLSSNFNSIKIRRYGNDFNLYVGHGGSSAGISVMNMQSGDWWFTAPNSLPVNDIMPDFLSDSYQKIYIGSDTFGLQLWDTNSMVLENVPGENSPSNLLLTIPSSDSGLCSTSQAITFLFSKPMEVLDLSGSQFTLESFTELRKGLSGGDLVNGSWAWDFTQRLAMFTPESLSKASPYNLTISLGSMALDGSYLSDGLKFSFYTENISPILGWNPLGKILALSGSNINHIDNIYLRNTETSGINIISLIGR